MYKFFLSFFLACVPATLFAEVVETEDKPSDVVLEIYPEGKALVTETRSADLIRGANKLLLRNIPRDVEQGSILLKAKKNSSNVEFTEYSFQSDQISRRSLLFGSVGLEVQLLPQSPTQPMQSVKLMAVNNGEAVVETSSGIQVVKQERIGFHRVPFRLTPQPLMTVKLISNVEETIPYEIDYLANGLSWDSSYTITVAHDASTLDMNSWIHIHNASGVEFTKAQVRIAEGQRESDNVVYGLPRPITLPDLASKNVEWFTAENVPTTRSYRISSPAVIHENEEGVTRKPSAEVWLSVENTDKLGLGKSLPAGLIKVFQKTADGQVGYMGENKTSAITPGETFSLRLGQSEDIKAEVKQTDFRKLSNQVFESGYSIQFSNETDRPLDLSFHQKLEGEWAILRETVDHESLARDKVRWRLKLAPHESQVLRFRVRMKQE